MILYDVKASKGFLGSPRKSYEAMGGHRKSQGDFRSHSKFGSIQSSRGAMPAAGMPACGLVGMPGICKNYLDLI